MIYSCLWILVSRDSLLRLPAHLFGDAHETMREYAQLNGVQFGGDLGSRSLADRYPRVAARRDRRFAIRLDQKSAQAVHYDRWSVNRVAGRQGAQLVHFGLLVAVLEIDHGGLILLEKRVSFRLFNV